MVGGRLLMVLEAYIDDSYEPDGCFALGGYIASAAAWANFSRDWEAMLPHGVRAKDGRFRFKMSEMAVLPERLERVPGFYRIIEHNVLAAISCAIDLREFERAKSRIWVQNRPIEWGSFNSYMFISRCLLDMFHSNRDRIVEFIPISEKIDFYFDNQSEKKAIISAWDSYIRQRPDEVRGYYGATPKFEDDKDFLPLQAADFWAWWVRKWHEEGDALHHIEKLNFNLWKAKRKYFPRIHVAFDEDQMVEAIKSLISGQLRPDNILCSINYSFK
jgi:hypothetical protein